MNKKINIIILIFMLFLLSGSDALAGIGGGEEADQKIKEYYATHPKERQEYIDKYCFNLSSHWDPEAAKKLCTLIGAYGATTGSAKPKISTQPTPIPSPSILPSPSELKSVEPAVSATPAAVKFNIWQKITNQFSNFWNKILSFFKK